MIIGIPTEVYAGENRVALTPDSTKKLRKKGFKFRFQRGCGERAGFYDEGYAGDGVELGSAKDVWSADIILKVNRPTLEEASQIKKGSLLISFMGNDAPVLNALAQAGVNSIGMEFIPRISRAQSMDALSSQANIAGYRAVIEAASRYGRFYPLMMTSAGSTKAAKVMILGAGVAGLQAIATAKRLGAFVEAYDIRAEVKEQIQSLGAKFVELDVGEEGSGAGGYAKELSSDAKQRQQQLLTERLKKSDVIVSTANVPGRKAPILITEEAVKGMRPGSVIVDMAAESGGNCALTEAGKVVVKHGVTLVGLTNYPSLVAADASGFYGNNLVSLLNLLVEGSAADQLKLNLNLEDEIVASSLMTHQGAVRQRK